MGRKLKPVQTQRLILRQWRDDDLKGFIELCGDTEVMRFFPTTLTAEQSAKALQQCRAHIDRQGYGPWAVERRDTDEFIGMVGLFDIESGFDFAPCVEVLWRLQRSTWGRGYATEAAKAAISFGFEQAGLNRIIAMTAVVNTPSEAVMRKLSMQKVGQFQHPKLGADHSLSEHVLYQIERDDVSLSG